MTTAAQLKLRLSIISNTQLSLAVLNAGIHFTPFNVRSLLPRGLNMRS